MIICNGYSSFIVIRFTWFLLIMQESLMVFLDFLFIVYHILFYFRYCGSFLLLLLAFDILCFLLHLCSCFFNIFVVRLYPCFWYVLMRPLFLFWYFSLVWSTWTSSRIASSFCVLFDSCLPSCYSCHLSHCITCCCDVRYGSSYHSYGYVIF